MGGPNLEVFKFGVYILFPIGIMYYFGTNLDNKFSVPNFWPTKEQSYRIPTDSTDIDEELDKLRAIRLAARHRRLERETLESGDADGLRELRNDSLSATVRSALSRTKLPSGREG